MNDLVLFLFYGVIPMNILHQTLRLGYLQHPQSEYFAADKTLFGVFTVFTHTHFSIYHVHICHVELFTQH